MGKSGMGWLVGLLWGWSEHVPLFHRSVTRILAGWTGESVVEREGEREGGLVGGVVVGVGVGLGWRVEIVVVPPYLASLKIIRFFFYFTLILCDIL